MFCFCAIDANGCFCTNNDYVGNDNSTNIHPATKEQCNQLEKAMTDAGYTFDFEKKELKKIEQKPTEGWYDFIRWFVKQRTDDYTLIPSDDDIHKWGDNILNHARKVLEQNPSWSEGDEKRLSDAITQLKAASNIIVGHEVGDSIAFIKSLKDRVQIKPQQEWNGGDDAHIHSIITHLQDFIESHPNTTGADIQGENVAWLKSLRPRSYWKPSEEQMRQLHKYCPDNRPLTQLYEQLKKLREE